MTFHTIKKGGRYPSMCGGDAGGCRILNMRLDANKSHMRQCGRERRVYVENRFSIKKTLSLKTWAII